MQSYIKLLASKFLLLGINLDQIHETTTATAKTFDYDVEIMCIQEDYFDLKHENNNNKSNFYANEDLDRGQREKMSQSKPKT